MIYEARREIQADGDKRVLDYMALNDFRNCLDIGGVHRPWASKHVTTYVDLVKPEDWNIRHPGMYEPFPEIWESKLILGDCEAEAWDELMEDVAKNGKYDFVVSTQMAEHLANPKLFFERLPLVADEGYIAVPNKLFELGRGREFSDEGIKRCGLTGSYRGAAPHRWIFTVKKNVLWGFPKLGMLELVDFGFEDKLKHYEPLDLGTLGFMWKDNIPVRIINDSDIDFPNPQEAIELYRKELSEGI